MKIFATHLPPAARLDDGQRRRGRLYAYASTWFGCYAEVMVDSSAIVILYLTMLRSSATLTMLSTAFSSLAAILLTIPGAAIASRIGLRQAYSLSCYIGCAGMLLMAAAPVLDAPLDTYAVLLSFFLLLLFLVPSIVPRTRDYYVPY